MKHFFGNFDVTQWKAEMSTESWHSVMWLEEFKPKVSIKSRYLDHINLNENNSMQSVECTVAGVQYSWLLCAKDVRHVTELFSLKAGRRGQKIHVTSQSLFTLYISRVMCFWPFSILQSFISLVKSLQSQQERCPQLKHPSKSTILEDSSI